MRTSLAALATVLQSAVVTHPAVSTFALTPIFGACASAVAAAMRLCVTRTLAAVQAGPCGFAVAPANLGIACARARALVGALQLGAVLPAVSVFTHALSLLALAVAGAAIQAVARRAAPPSRAVALEVFSTLTVPTARRWAHTHGAIVASKARVALANTSSGALTVHTALLGARLN